MQSPLAFASASLWTRRFARVSLLAAGLLMHVHSGPSTLPGRAWAAELPPALTVGLPEALSAKSVSVGGLRPITRGMRPRAATHASDAANIQLAALAGGRALTAIGPAPLASREIVIDVMVAFTAKAARNYRNIEQELIAPAVAAASQSFAASGIGHVKLHLAHTYQTDYVEVGDHFDHVWALADKGDGHIEEVHAFREKFGADIVLLVVDDQRSGCGQATRVHADAEDAFAVVHHACAAENHTLAHEVGHILGATHERGYVRGTEWRDIMSYKTRCGGCPRMAVWSNPALLIDGKRAGSDQLDNASVIAANAARVAVFR